MSSGGGVANDFGDGRFIWLTDDELEEEEKENKPMNTQPVYDLHDLQAFISQKLADIQTNASTNQTAMDAAHAAELDAAKAIASDAGATQILMALAAEVAAKIGDQTGTTTPPTLGQGVTDNGNGTFTNAQGQPSDAQGNAL